MAKQITLHGFPVQYEDNAFEGIRYLRDDLDYNEARVFFDQARERGSAPFEDDADRQYTLLYRAGVYTLVRR
jgi:hypothetical protein